MAVLGIRKDVQITVKILYYIYISKTLWMGSFSSAHENAFTIISMTNSICYHLT